MLGWLKTARETMVRLGMADVPLYVTEFGWTVRPRGAPHWVPGRVRPGYIRRSFAALAHTDCGIGGAYLYTWVTPGRDPRNGEDWFGIHLPATGSRQNTLALAEGIAAARRPGPLIRLCG
jgi:hypothetical protein